jgi:LPS-assembly lipoprotein
MRIVVIALAAASLALAGCGFQLREELQLPQGFDNVRLEVADPASPLARDLAAALKRAGATVRDSGSEGALVRIALNSLATEPLTVGGNARVQEYVVRYRIELEVLDAGGAVQLARTPVVLERDYSFDETQALGAAAQEQLLREELQREMVQQVLRRIGGIR